MDLHLDNIMVGTTDGKAREITKEEAWILSQYFSDHSTLEGFEEEIGATYVEWKPKILTEEEHLQYCKEYLAKKNYAPTDYVKWFWGF